MIYLDNAATTSLSPRIRDILVSTYETLYANSSSPHQAGLFARDSLEDARRRIAGMFRVDPGGIYFTSAATESINTLFQGYTKFISGSTRNEILVSQIEHPAVYETAHYLRTQGFIVHELQNDNYGRVHLDDLRKKMSDKTALVAIMSVNNETGVIQNISEAVKCVKDRDRKILFFTDTVQALGKINVAHFTEKVDAFCGSAHKVGGPKGVGFLYLNPEFRSLPLMYGGSQELSYRPGTVNVPGIALMAEALEDRIVNLDTNAQKVAKLRDHLEGKMIQKMINFSRVIPSEFASPYIFCMSLPINNDYLLEKLSERDVCISKRSACSSEAHSKSRILESMNIPDDEIDRIVRVSFSPETTEEEIDSFVENLESILQEYPAKAQSFP
jgi:cysteine desulfurase